MDKDQARRHVFGEPTGHQHQLPETTVSFGLLSLSLFLHVTQCNSTEGGRAREGEVRVTQAQREAAEGNKTHQPIFPSCSLD